MYMKNMIFTTVIFLLELISITNAQTREIALDCPTGWTLKNNHCYRYFPDPAPWDNAKAVCDSYGSHLVAGKDYYENEDVGKFVETSGGSRFWIGVDRIGVSSGLGGSIFINKQESITANGYWADYQPDITVGECVVVEKVDDKYDWSFNSCEQKNAFVCSRKVCPEGSFHCSNNRCLNTSLTCDGEDDCGDNSDELNCASRCGMVLKQETGEIMSENHPAQYPANQNCFWLIEVPVTYNAHLKFTDFATEEGLDKVQIFVGGMTESTSELVATLSGDMSSKLPEYISHNNFLMVKFSSDASTAANGFKAMFSAKKEMFPMMKMLTATSTYQTLTPPSYPDNYLGNQDYTWIITAEQRTSIVTLQIEEIDLKENDLLIVRDGENVMSEELLRLTSSNEITSPFIFSSKPKIYITLQTRGYNTGKGFKLEYKQGCSIEFVASQGMILSPGFNAGKYPNYANCDWLIKEKEGKPMTLSFISFDVKSPGDVLKVYNGSDASSPLIGDYTGTLEGDSLPSILADLGTLFLGFTSDATGSSKGFQLEFSVDCPAPNFNSFTTTTPATPSNSPGSTFEVECAKGYHFAAEEFRDGTVKDKFKAKAKITMTCSRGGKWNTLRVPTCEPLYCGKAPELANGYTVNLPGLTGVTVGQSIFYKCSNGYKFKDVANSVECMDTGEWGIMPVCEAVACAQLGAITAPLKSVEEDMPYGKLIKFSCEEGYELEGAKETYCKDDGQYSEQIPKCAIKLCVVNQIENAMQMDMKPVEYGNKITYTCKQGYMLSKSGEVTCGADGQFASLPECNDIDECNTTKGGCSEMCQNTMGSFMCSCPDGYTLNADKARCDDIKECDTDKGGCSDKCKEMIPGYKCECNMGRELFTSDGVSSYSVMSPEDGLRNGDVLHYNHTCVDKQCPTPEITGVLILLTKKTIFRYQDMVEFACPIGYMIQGDKELTCQDSGTWNGALPTCEAITCVAITDKLKNTPVFEPANKSVSYKEELSMTCTYGDGSTKTRKRFCLYSQQTDKYELIGDDYECGTIDCGKPPNIPGAVYEGYSDGDNTSFGATYTFKCAELYTIVTNIADEADRVISCGADMKWDAKDMRCEGITCTDPGRPVNGYQNATSYEEGKLVTFGCTISGYTLDTDGPITCVKNGAGNGLEWNGTVPKCVDTQKPEITDCQDIEVELYAAASAIKIPSFSDNGGIKTMTVTPFHPSAEILITTEGILTFELEDYAGNTADCSTKISLADTVAPILTCPESYAITIETESDVKKDKFSSNPATVTDESGKATITYNPTYVSAEFNNLNIPQPVSVTAVDEAGNMASCTFQVVTTAADCSPLSFPVAAHTTKSCTNITNGYQCNLTCESGYRFLDSSDASVFSCIDNSPWDQAQIDSVGGCSRADVDAKYTLRLKYEYKAENNVNIDSSCPDKYKKSIANTMSEAVTALANYCVTTFKTPTTVTSVVQSVTKEGQSIFATFDIQLVGNQAVQCGNNLIQISDNPYTFITDLYNGPYSTDICPVITGVVEKDKVSVENTFQDFSCDSTRMLAEYDGNAKCLLCPEGYENVNFTSGMIDCKPCGRGLFTVDGIRQTCESCAVATTTYRTGSYSNADCIAKCAEGSTSPNGLAPCIECARNTYYVNESLCTPCPNNGITRQSASKSVAECKAPCAAGSYSYDGHEPCQLCPKSFYSSAIGSKICQECSDTQTTASTGSSASIACVDANICAGDNPCQNEGTCQSSKHIFKCVCKEGFYGERCELIFDPCSSNPCYNNGVCTASGSNYSCSCPDGTEGTQCETDLNNCSPYPCGSNGMCQDLVNEFLCHCKSGYKGQTCSETSDICVDNPCSTEGTNGDCVKQGTARRKCNCKLGYSGDDCSTNIDDCSSTPCLDRGTCSDLLNDFKCNCSSGFDGTQCTTRFSLCEGVACTNGMCVEDHIKDTYQCLCNKGYMYNSTSMTCDMIDNCASNPCMAENTMDNGCSSDINGFMCACKDGFNGSKCQHSIDDCANNPCSSTNSIKCNDLLKDYSCDCKEGYDGKECQRIIDKCTGSPCNSSIEGVDQCKIVLGDYDCQCKPGYTGRNCETEIDECAGKPCLHGSNCTDMVNEFKCECAPGWTGPTCSKAVLLCAGKCVNDAQCYDIFNDYYCDCKDNTHGRDCDQVEKLCESANPCIHDQTCVETGGVKCECSSEWKGSGCEIAVDYCSEDVCKNGGKCTASLSNYTCECFNGYKGRNCDENPDNCAGITCPGNAMCVDGEDQYFCRCPLGKVGKDCDKDLDTDYMLLFSSPMKDGMAAFPYPIPFNSTQFSISFWVRFWDKDDTGTFLSIFFTESQASTKVTSKLLSIDHEGLKIMNGTEEKSYKSKFTKHNDGKWHNIAVTWNRETGILRYVVDSLSNGPIEDFSTGVTVDSNVWVVLGVKYDYMNKKPMKNEGFRGWISQVNLYSSVVDFESEIPKLLREPQKVFNNSNPVQLWSDYELMSSVQRIPKSTILHPEDSCPRGFTNPSACDTKMPGKTQVMVEKCPSDIIMLGEKRITQAMWEIPEFSNSDTVISNYVSNSQFLWGKYHIVYQAMSNAGHKALCYFDLFIQYDNCTAPEDPTNGGQIYRPANGEYHAASVVSCKAGFDFAQPKPNLYTCDRIGSWNPPRKYNTFVLPPCGEKKAPANVRVKFIVKYKIQTDVCDQVRQSLTNLIREQFAALNPKYDDTLCKESDCSDLVIVIECTTARRRKRQTSDITAEIVMPLVPDQLPSPGGGFITPEEFLNQLLLGGGGELDFKDQIPGATPDPNTVAITVTPSCPEGQTVINGQCVECAAGTYYDVNTLTCKSCPMNQYQDQTGQKECKPCTNGLTTENEGSSMASDCKATCPTGSEFKDGSCMKCALGFYQNMTGQFFCMPCPVDKTTKAVGATSESECFNDCPLGEELTGNGECQKCPVGKYRSGDDTSCVACDAGTTTAGEGSTARSDCNLGDCLKGQKRTTGIDCEDCPVNTYQGKIHQSECIACNTSYRTDQPASKSPTDCKFFCQDGHEQLNKDSTDCTKCKIGFFRKSADKPYDICQPCPNGFKTPGEGSVMESECTIFKCPAGHYPVSGKCEPCPLGEYQPEAEQESCIKCSAELSTRETGATNISQCESYCDSGKEKNGTTCVACNRGYYKNNTDGLFGDCMLCPIDFITAGNGSMKASDCNVKNCSAGTKLEGNTCVDCPVGFYQDTKWQTDCIKCDSEKTTENEGADRKELCILKCEPGKEDVNGTCTDCQIGFYKSTLAAEKCKECDAGFITTGTGSEQEAQCNIVACPPGEYRSSLNQCEKCTYGQYQPMKWQESCLTCSSGDTTYFKGAKDISDCKEDCAAGSENINNTCSLCPIGYFRDKIDKEQPRCLKCPIGTITTTTGATETANCTVKACTTPGEYLDESSNMCKKCPKGQYQDEVWQKMCKQCATGETTENNGSSKASDCKTDCLAGSQFNDATKQCEKCPVGQYRDKTTWDCQACPDQLSTTQPGAVSDSECTKSPCKAGEKFDRGQTQCVPCPANTYQPDANKFECIQCTRGEFTTSPGSKLASDCTKKCSADAYNDCHSNAVCTDVATDKGYTCTCKSDYGGDGVNCTNKCLLGYCGDFGTCVQSTPISCSCQEQYEGTQCESRKDASKSGPKTNETIIIGVVTAAALLLFIILIVVCIIVRARRRHQKRKPFLNEYDDRSVGTRMSFQNYDPYGSKAPSVGGQRLMLPSNVEKMYDNPVFGDDDPAVYRA